MTTKTEAGCINARGALNTHGYGRIKLNGIEYGAHRISYLLFNGEIPKNLQIDHLCKNRKCINPKHLRLVTVAENVLSGSGLCAINKKKTHCKRGHLLAVENIYKQPSRPSIRLCKKCRSILDLKRRNQNGN